MAPEKLHSGRLSSLAIARVTGSSGASITESGMHGIINTTAAARHYSYPLKPLPSYQLHATAVDRSVQYNMLMRVAFLWLQN